MRLINLSVITILVAILPYNEALFPVKKIDPSARRRYSFTFPPDSSRMFEDGTTMQQTGTPKSKLGDSQCSPCGKRCDFPVPVVFWKSFHWTISSFPFALHNFPSKKGVRPREYPIAYHSWCLKEGFQVVDEPFSLWTEAEIVDFTQCGALKKSKAKSETLFKHITHIILLLS